jgi:hypothetical protein
MIGVQVQGLLIFLGGFLELAQIAQGAG